ncbi:MAG: homocysteine S-methyltransferase family protein [Desulfovibrionaceae bacterium]|nr:homocysteine S-methyltransferase family protein [Desulfovibrionaceae bacterium]
MGTMLQQSGMPVGVSPERFCEERPDLIVKIRRAYVEAGCDILTTCTFGANPYKLSPDLNLYDFNRKMARVARDASQGFERDIYVAGNLGPSGQFLKPLGGIEPRDLIWAYKRQVEGLLAGGVDLFLIETQFDLAEARACVIAVRESCDLPLIVSMTFEEGTCLTGSSPEIFAETMDNLGVEVIGTNCSVGPLKMAEVVERYLAVSSTPILAEPNAGLPKLEGDKTVFPLGPKEYAEQTSRLASLGCKILGGCCGTTPSHMQALKKAVEKLNWTPPSLKVKSGVSLTTRTELVTIGGDAPLVLIGERINPTGKKQLTAEFQAKSLKLACDLADEQVAEGARVLDLNVGAPLVEEEKLLPRLVQLLTLRLQVPLSLDSAKAQAILEALPYCPGSALVNSISGEAGRMELLGPVCKKYGAPFILLPLKGKDLPLEASYRRAILEDLLKQALDLGIPRRLILVDILALTVSSTPLGAKTCLEMLAFCKDQGLASTLGLSNISFGLPARELLNATFLSMAAGCGLSSCIANPKALRVKEALAAIKVLSAKDPQAGEFIAEYSDWSQTSTSKQSKVKKAHQAENLSEAVLFGDKERVGALVSASLQAGQDPFSLVQEVLIPAITEVGARYERKEYYLPQLIRSAETMQEAFNLLKPRLKRQGEVEKLPVIIMATVEGDIHDIGKNIVSLLLSNHGFEVVDLGKDVPAKDIVDSAIYHGASIIGLSALMTTTMVKMQETIDLLKIKHLPMKVMIGGAAVTQSFADKIGADAYCEDAVAAVRTAQALLSQA